MKTKTLLRPLLMIALMLIMLISWTVIQSDMVYADEETTYTVFLYSGKEGYFGDPDTTMLKFDNIKFGSEFTIDQKNGRVYINGEKEKAKLVVRDEDQYYARGYKDAGHDNDEIYSSYTFTVKEDMSFAVAYGMKGGMVEYTVNYEAEDGTVLHDPETFWGMPGDRPVVSYKRVEGYLPNQYNETRTLTDNPAVNIFTFTYRELTSEEAANEDEGTDNAVDDGGNAGGNAAGNAGGANAGTTPAGTTPDGTAPADNQGQTGDDQGENIDNPDTPQAQPGDIENLDDPDTPEAEPIPDDGGPESAPGSSILYYILGGAIAVAIIAILALLLARKKKEE